MASSEAGREDGCAGTSVDAGAGGSGSGSVGGHGGAELRSSSWDQAMESSSSPSTSPPYWDSDDDDPGPRPSDLYGKFTWKIEKFSEISNRELRSNVFEVGGYKWYILVYPQGCDVCNHLSLFLCVSDYDKLLPGWSHFAQFTIAVVNKDPKKSKYSDTLHRFCKKEHDWGWKKFMELSKVLDGFIVADILVIKAQVQVIRENSNRPFRCLDSQYRRELVRVYLTNVEGICRRFVEEKREKLAKLIEDTNRWSSFRGFWAAIDETVRHRLSREKTDVILKAIVKRFFNEKEVTSTLVMDALYSGCKALNYRSKSKKEKYTNDEGDNSFPVVWVEKDYFVLVDDVLSLLERAATEPLPPFKEDKGPQNRTKDCSGDDFAKDSVERDERRLTELGKRTIEIYVLAHLFSNRVEVAYREAIALKRQEELIREEEAAGQAEIEFRAKREAAEKEKKSKKKQIPPTVQAKQRRNNRKDKNRVKDEKASPLVQEKDRQELTSKKQNAERTSNQCAIPNLGASTMADEDDELSGIDATDNVVGTLGPATEDGEAYRVDWDRDGSETPQSMEASFSGDICAQPAQSGRTGRKHQATIDDSSSTCSTDSLASIVVNGSYKGKTSVPNHNQSLNWCDRGKSRTGSERCERATSLSEADNLRQAASTDSNAIQDANNMIASLISEKLSLKECVQQLGQRNAELEQRNAELEQFKADLEVRNAELERQNAGLLASANAEAKNLSMKDRERQLELSLAEKEEELEMLRAKLKVLQQEMDDLKSSRQTQEKLANTSVKRDSDRAGVSQADESRHTSSSMSSDLSSTNLNKSCHVESPASQATTNNTSNSKSNLPKSNSGKNTMPASYSSGRIDNHKSLVHNLNTTELNRNSNAQKTVAGSEENVATVSGQQNSHAASGSSEATDLSRPSSAPLIPAGAKPTMPVVSIQSTPSLSRSVSASGRLGVGESAAASASSVCQSQPVTPSYKMAAVGKIRSQYNGQIPISISSSNSQIGSSTQNSNLTHLPSTNQMPTAHTASSTLPASPQQNHRMVLNQEGSSIGDCFPSTSAAPCLSIPPVPSSVPGKEHGRYGPSNHIERPVGFTFGSVTPEMLNRQRSRDYAQSIEESMPLMEEESLKIDQHEQQAIFEHYLQHQPQSLQNLKFFQSQDPDPQDLRVHQSALNDLNIQGTPLHLSSIADARQSSSLFSEEFPHIDIINDLLDDEHYRGGRTLSMMLQNSAAHPSHRRVPHPGFERSNSSHLHSDLNILKNERPDMSRFQDDGLFQLHSTTDPSNIGFRENLHMLSPYAHSGYGQSYNQQGAMFDGVHHWPMSNADYSGANVNGNAYGSVNGHLGYPLHTNSISLGDCSSFSSGQTDYTMFSPRKDM